VLGALAPLFRPVIEHFAGKAAKGIDNQIRRVREYAGRQNVD